MDASAQLLALADRYDAACATRAVGRLSSEDRWRTAVHDQCEAIDKDFRRVYDDIARAGLKGLSGATSCWMAMHQLATEYPDQLNAEYPGGFNAAAELVKDSLSTVISLRGPGHMCRALAKMVASEVEQSAPTIPDMPAQLVKADADIEETAHLERMKRISELFESWRPLADVDQALSIASCSETAMFQSIEAGRTGIVREGNNPNGWRHWFAVKDKGALKERLATGREVDMYFRYLFERGIRGSRRPKSRRKPPANPVKPDKVS